MTIERAIVLAARAHAGQTCKYTPEPYILHCIRVMMMGETEEERILGVLHDIVEDTDLQLWILRVEGCQDPIIDALVAISREAGETYNTYLRRVARNDLARRVKLHDLADNTAPGRVENLTPKHAERYFKAIVFLRRCAEGALGDE